MVAHVVKEFLIFMEFEGSFMLSKEAATGHYPAPAQSRLYNLGITSTLVNNIVNYEQVSPQKYSIYFAVFRQNHF